MFTFLLLVFKGSAMEQLKIENLLNALWQEIEINILETTDELNSQKLTELKERIEIIIAEAEREAKNIIMEAQKQANVIITESNVEEKDEFLKKIQDMKVDELREIVASSDVFTPEQYKGMKKAELIDAIMKIKYSQE